MHQGTAHAAEAFFPKNIKSHQAQHGSAEPQEKEIERSHSTFLASQLGRFLQVGHERKDLLALQGVRLENRLHGGRGRGHQPGCQTLASLEALIGAGEIGAQSASAQNTDIVK